MGKIVARYSQLPEVPGEDEGGREHKRAHEKRPELPGELENEQRRKWSHTKEKNPRSLSRIAHRNEGSQYWDDYTALRLIAQSNDQGQQAGRQVFSRYYRLFPRLVDQLPSRCLRVAEFHLSLHFSTSWSLTKQANAILRRCCHYYSAAKRRPLSEIPSNYVT